MLELTINERILSFQERLLDLTREGADESQLLERLGRELPEIPPEEIKEAWKKSFVRYCCRRVAPGAPVGSDSDLLNRILPSGLPATVYKIPASATLTRVPASEMVTQWA